MSFSTWGQSTPSTAEARAIAVWLLSEAQAHRMPPVVAAEAEFDDVRLTIEPSEAWQWDVWSNLLATQPGRTTWRGECVTAHGSWNGVHVVLTGLNPTSWAAS